MAILFGIMAAWAKHKLDPKGLHWAMMSKRPLDFPPWPFFPAPDEVDGKVLDEFSCLRFVGGWIRRILPVEQGPLFFTANISQYEYYRARGQSCLEDG